MSTSFKGKNYGEIERRGVEHDYDVVRKIDLDYPDSRFVFDLETSDHWFSVNGFVVHNCCLINYPDMLENGFKIGDAEIEQPKSIGVATTVSTQIVQAVASAQYGGSTLSHIDTHWAPYVEMSYKKLLNKVEQGILNEKFVWSELDKEVYDAMQTFLYQVNSLTTTNGQAPFISISFGLDTSVFGKMITKNYLKVHSEGIGKDKITPVFPKVIFFLQEGVNMNKEDPSYDLKQDAISCAVKRVYPDWISLPLNKQTTGAEQSATTCMGEP